MEIKYYELVFNKDEEGMCIFGVREPTPEEATELIKTDLESTYFSDKVERVCEIDKHTAESCFDFDDIRECRKRPVFGSDKTYGELLDETAASKEYREPPF